MSFVVINEKKVYKLEQFVNMSKPDENLSIKKKSK